MSALAGKAVLPFEPKMKALMDAIGVTDTPQNLRPNLGPLSLLKYKPSRWRYLLRLSAAPTVGSVEIKLLSGTTVIRSEAFSLVGATTLSNNVAVDLSQVSGESDLSVRVDVTAAADAGITATLDSVVDVEQPLTIAGC